jgi:hypothetical protein
MPAARPYILSKKTATNDKNYKCYPSSLKEVTRGTS